MAATVRVKCPLCSTWLDVKAERQQTDSDALTTTVELNTGLLMAHVRKCAEVAPLPETPGKTPATTNGRRPAPGREINPLELAERMRTFNFKGVQFVASGRRACTGCGTANPVCLRQLGDKRGACCGMCSEGNTHPAVAGDVDCATWGITHGATH